MRTMVHKKHLRGYVRDMRRLPAATQTKTLTAFGVPEKAIYTDDKSTGGSALLDATRSLRRGDVLAMVHGHLLAPPKVKTSDKPRDKFWKALHAIEERGGSALDLTAQLHTADKLQRDQFIQRVIEALASAARGHSSVKNGKMSAGRPPIVTTPDDDKLAERVWFDRRYKTNTEAMKHGPPSYSRQRYYDKFGPSGRGS